MVLEDARGSTKETMTNESAISIDGDCGNSNRRAGLRQDIRKYHATDINTQKEWRFK